ncbi:hypothetical protein MSEDJ_18970 [Mycolicibacterium sediminis]|uniref:Integrase catalytic domain-containing protein n=1 Tax=Mycolicibacterium sediminis TaxID=1286180 RepID=A0A7I7QN98_9MYCO|nr:hypothetical protein MSEDJ_18970 [Mycolicibacterium sediminis]
MAVRAALEASGLDHGPISVHDKMHAMGLPQVPSTAALARIFREAGVARLEPKKKARSAWRRFVYPAPNACWQLDATEYVLSGGRTCVIFQLIDDHSRYAVASHVAWSETAQAAIAVFDKAVADRGVPQRLLSDNGAALNPSRRGHLGRLVSHVGALGVQTITGKPYKPTTQGKNERFHQTLFRYLDKQPLAGSLAELQAQGRRVRPPLQHRTPPPGPARSHHPADGVGRHPPRRSAPSPAGPADLPSARSERLPQAPHSATTEPARQHPCQNDQHCGDHSSGHGHLPSRRTTRLRAGPRRHRRRPGHHHRPSGRSPRRAHPTRTRYSIRRQRSTTGPTPQNRQTVTEVLTHQLSPKS